MEPQTLVAIVGLVLAVGALAVMITQLVWPGLFAHQKSLSIPANIRFNRSVGFGILAAVAALLLAAIIQLL